MHWLQMAILASTTSVSPTHSGTLTKEQFGTHDATIHSATCGSRKGQQGIKVKLEKPRTDQSSALWQRSATGAHLRSVKPARTATPHCWLGDRARDRVLLGLWLRHGTCLNQFLHLVNPVLVPRPLCPFADCASEESVAHFLSAPATLRPELDCFATSTWFARVFSLPGHVAWL